MEKRIQSSRCPGEYRVVLSGRWSSMTARGALGAERRTRVGVPATPSTWLLLVLPPSVFLVEAGWYAIVATLFSSRRPRAIYVGAKGWIDRVAGAVMGALGVRLISEGVVSLKA